MNGTNGIRVGIALGVAFCMTASAATAEESPSDRPRIAAYAERVAADEGLAAFWRMEGTLADEARKDARKNGCD